jgi:hypothetical protein
MKAFNFDNGLTQQLIHETRLTVAWGREVHRSFQETGHGARAR